MSFEDKVVIVTGASSGIGESLARKFAEEGAKVVLVDINQKRLKDVARRCGIIGSKLSIVADVTNEDDVKRIVHETVQFFGQIDVLINNVGIGTGASIIGDNAIEVFDKVMATNLRSSVYLSHLVGKHLVETSGSIINISSVCSKSVRVTNSFSYYVSKAALDVFTKTIAAELASKGVRVNSINPGPVKTNILQSMAISEEEQAAAWEGYKELTALKRLSEPKEIVELALFLASKKAVAITGSSFVVDNGFLVNTQF